jgi:hypothetical protein
MTPITASGPYISVPAALLRRLGQRTLEHLSGDGVDRELQADADAVATLIRDQAPGVWQEMVSVGEAGEGQRLPGRRIWLKDGQHHD